MNKIEGNVIIKNNLMNDVKLIIDGENLDEIINGYTNEPLHLGLISAWAGLDDFYESDYIWRHINRRDNVNLPILVCPDDADLSCIVIIVDINYFDEKIVWNRVGILIHNNSKAENIKWQKSGIRNFTKWSSEEWDLYGEILNTLDIWDSSWDKWISDNWEIEATKRLDNYSHNYFNNDMNIKWVKNIPKFEFDRNEYDSCIEIFRDECVEFYKRYHKRMN